MAQQNQAEKPKFMCSSAAFEVLQQCLHQKVDDRSKAQLDSGQVKAKKKKKRKEKGTKGSAVSECEAWPEDRRVAQPISKTA